MRPLSRLLPLMLLLPLAWLGGCGMLDSGESAEVQAARREAEGKAVGGACRHAGRAIEDCFAMNKRSDKAALFAGWREMNDYMRDNKIEALPPRSDTPPEVAAKADTAAAAEDAAKKPAPAKKQDS